MTRRASRALLSLVLLLGVCVATLGDAFVAGTARAADAPAPAAVAVGIGYVNPLVPDGTATQTFTIRGAVRNTSTTPHSVSVQLRVSYVKYRYDLVTDTPTGHEGKPVGKPTPIDGSMSPQEQRPWTIGPMQMHALLGSRPDPGVYAIDVVATEGTSGTGTILGVQRTFLVWKPLTSSASPVSVALLWPMVGPPALTGGKDANSGAVPTLADTGRLTDQIQQDGRLDQVVGIGKALGPTLTWVVDPDLLYTVRQLNQGYLNGTSLTSGAAAVSWLAAAQSAIKGQSCWNLPYADPDIASLARAPGGVDLLKGAATLGAPVGLTCDHPEKVLAWPGSGQSDQATTKAIHQALPNATALVSNVFEGDGDLTSTHVSLDGSVKALAADGYLSDVFAPVPDDGMTDAGLLAGQRWLAQTALLARDNEAGRVVIASPPRDFAPTPSLLAALQAVGRLAKADQWVSFTNLDSIPTPASPKKWSSPSAQTATKSEPVQQANLAPNLVNSAATAESTYLAYQSVLESKSTSDPALPYRLVATSWRGRPTEAKGYSAAVLKQINDLHDAVSLSTSAPLTLSGKTGKIPVTVRNNLLVPVTVNVHAVSDLPIRLSVTEQPGTIVVPARGTSTVQIPVHAVGSGQHVQVTTQLCQPRKDGQSCTPYYPAGTDGKNGRYLGKTVSDVKVSAIGIIALALMLGSAAVLVMAIGVRVYRANRAHHTAGHDTMAS